MGMPRLRCEIDLVRAQLRENNSDLQAAGVRATLISPLKDRIATPLGSNFSNP
jgi:hypothetical protein